MFVIVCVENVSLDSNTTFLKECFVKNDNEPLQTLLIEAQKYPSLTKKLTANAFLYKTRLKLTLGHSERYNPVWNITYRNKEGSCPILSF